MGRCETPGIRDKDGCPMIEQPSFIWSELLFEEESGGVHGAHLQQILENYSLTSVDPLPFSAVVATALGSCCVFACSLLDAMPS
jgi:hypothetical protein